MSNIRIAELAAERERDRIMYLREIENAKTQERERIIQLLYKWDSLMVFEASDPEDDLKILGEMRRAYQIGWERGVEDNA